VKRSGGTIHIVNRIPGLSTSRLLDTLQAAATPSDASDQPVAAFRRRTEGGGAPDWQSATTEVPAPLAGRDMDTII
jgi:hypothetical protein